MVGFNSTQYSAANGNLSEGFQGRPDTAVYRGGLKESQNFFSGADGVLRFRKSFPQGKCAAPAVDSSGASTGAVKTLYFYVTDITDPGKVFVDMVQDQTTGNYTAMFFRREGESYLSGKYACNDAAQGSGDYTISSYTADGEVTLDTSMDDEVHRVGSFVSWDTIGALQHGLISEADSSSKDEVKLVQVDGTPFTAMTMSKAYPLRSNGRALTTPIGEDFDWTEVPGLGLIITDGVNDWLVLYSSTGGGAGVSIDIREVPAFTNDPTPAGDMYSKVDWHEGRLVIGGYKTTPAMLGFSTLGTTGVVPPVAWNDFTTGTAATDAIVIEMAPAGLPAIEEVRWMAGTKRALLVGVSSGIVEVISVGYALSP